MGRLSTFSARNLMNMWYRRNAYEQNILREAPEGVLRSKLSFLEDKSQIWSNSFEPEAIKVNDES